MRRCSLLDFADELMHEFEDINLEVFLVSVS